MKVGDRFYYYMPREKTFVSREISFVRCSLETAEIEHIYWGGTVVDHRGNIWYDGRALINDELVYSHNLKQLEVS